MNSPRTTEERAVDLECTCIWRLSNYPSDVDPYTRIVDRDCEVHGADYDPTSWCSGCGARKQEDCHCGPIAEND